jgi:hypothetical protein
MTAYHNYAAATVHTYLLLEAFQLLVVRQRLIAALDFGLCTSVSDNDRCAPCLKDIIPCVYESGRRDVFLENALADAS